MTPTQLTLHIEELELDGISAAQRFEVSRGLESELGRLLLEQGIPRGLSTGVLEMPPLDVAPQAAPLELGRAVARAVYEGWR